MQTVRSIELGKKYSIKGRLVEAVQILTYGRKPLSGTKIIHFSGEQGIRFKATQWPDGTIYRITKCA